MHSVDGQDSCKVEKQRFLESMTPSYMELTEWSLLESWVLPPLLHHLLYSPPVIDLRIPTFNLLSCTFLHFPTWMPEPDLWVCASSLCHTMRLVLVEAIPMYVEELLLLLTCYVEGTSWDDSSSWSRAVVLYKRWTLFIYYKHCDAWLWHVTCDM